MESQTRFALLAVLLAAAFAPSTARAQASAAEALFKDGRTALAAGDLETACARFRASDEADPAAGTKANLAECEERRGRVATAWELYRTVLGQIPPTDPRVPLLKQRIDALDPRLPRLVIKLAAGAPPDTTVRDGDALLGTGAFGVPLPLDPGVHHLTVTASGRAAQPFEVTLTMGKTETIEVAPGEKSGGGGASPGPWIVGGVGAAALVVGAVTGGLVLQKKSAFDATVHMCAVGGKQTECTTAAGASARSAIDTLGPVTTVALVAGGAAVAGAAIWLGVRRRGSTTVRVGVAPAPAGASLRLEGAW